MERRFLVRALGLAVAAVLLGSLGEAKANTTYDAGADFSTAANPNGVWSYGWEPTLGGSFTLLAGSNNSILEYPLSDIASWQGYNSKYGMYYPFVSANITNSTILAAGYINYPPGQLIINVLSPPLDSSVVVVRFVAPNDGSYDIASTFEGQDSREGSTADYVQMDGATLYSGTINGYGPSTVLSYDTTLSLHQGDTLDFVLAPNSTNENGGLTADSSSLGLTITSVPEPTSLGILGFGVMGMLVRRRGGRRGIIG